MNNNRAFAQLLNTLSHINFTLSTFPELYGFVNEANEANKRKRARFITQSPDIVNPTRTRPSRFFVGLRNFSIH